MNQNSRIAIYTIVNKRDVFEEFKTQLNLQKNVDYHLHEIFNCDGEYDSARKAFNENAIDKDVNYNIFLHPDIRFLDEYALADIVKTVDRIDDFGVAGIAGAKQSGKNREIVSTIVQGNQKARVGSKIDIPTKVQTVDECFFVIKKEYFDNHKFSEKSGWHLYGVEYCLNALREGKNNYVIPSRVWHMSPGNSLDEKYMSQLEEILHEYGDEHEMICTTVKAWTTNGLIAYIYRKYYWIKQRIKRCSNKLLYSANRRGRKNE